MGSQPYVATSQPRAIYDPVKLASRSGFKIWISSHKHLGSQFCCSHSPPPSSGGISRRAFPETAAATDDRQPGWRVDEPNPLQVMSQDIDDVFDFLARIGSDEELREALNLLETAEDVAQLAKERGHRVSASTLLELFERCQEAPRARPGLMDEKLIRVFLQRDKLR